MNDFVVIEAIPETRNVRVWFTKQGIAFVMEKSSCFYIFRKQFRCKLGKVRRWNMWVGYVNVAVNLWGVRREEVSPDSPPQALAMFLPRWIYYIKYGVKTLKMRLKKEAGNWQGIPAISLSNLNWDSRGQRWLLKDIPPPHIGSVEPTQRKGLEELGEYPPVLLSTTMRELVRNKKLLFSLIKEERLLRTGRKFYILFPQGKTLEEIIEEFPNPKSIMLLPPYRKVGWEEIDIVTENDIMQRTYFRRRKKPRKEWREHGR